MNSVVSSLLAVMMMIAPVAFGENWEHRDCCGNIDRDVHMETISLERGFHLNQGEMRSITVNHRDWRYVKNLHLQVEASGSSAWISVSANGTKKGNFLVPASDPAYLVTIGESVRTIEITNTGGGRVFVRDLKAVVARLTPRHGDDLNDDNLFDFDYTPGAYPEIDRFFERNEATSLSRAAILIVKVLNGFADPETEVVPYLLPIKIAAGRVLYIAESRGVLGAEVRPALEALVAQIVFAKPYTDSLLKKDATFELGIRLLALKEKIKDIID